MSSQNASPRSDASIYQPRQQSGILTPSSQSFDLSDGLGAKKRKRDGNSLEDLLKDKFVVKPYPTKGISRPRTLQPILLLPRSHLPLSYLDIGSTNNPLPQSRLFETHVKILELEERMSIQPMVLIARLDDNRTLYAVEREDRGLYVVLQLGSWINLHELKTVAVAAQIEPVNLPGNGQLLGFPGPDTSKVPLITPEGSKYSKKKKLAIEAIQSMVKRPSTPIVTEPRPQSATYPPAVDSQNDTQMHVDAQAVDTTTQSTATEIFDNIRTQYFETLYLSKTSLAYFPKGPLSRARAAFNLDFDSTLDMREHVAFLETLVLSGTLLDKKYRDGVPNCVSLVDLHDDSADDTKTKKKKRKTTKKMKPGKNGLYPNEESLINKWWIGHDEEAESGIPGSKDAIMKKRIADLRIRETQLQMIVILEIFALQPLLNDNIDQILPTLLTGVIESKERTPKTRKSDHLSMLIDVHIDRLCIWQSITSETTKAPDADSNSGPAPINATKHTDNILRDFCIEVIAPFFSARLPDRCDAINRKLGGPVTKAATKPKIPKSASFSNALSRPGAVTKRPVPVKPRKSLQHVLTDERARRSMSIGSSRAISLMRSATDSCIPGLKREASEAPSLSNIPAAESKPLQASRGGVLNSKRFAQREVDMSALAPDLTSKAKKQAAIEAELKDAISALKKPNRELAGKALAETAELRSASAPHPRKSKKPVRNPLFQGIQSVQIKATPKSNRHKDMFSESQPSTSIPKHAEVIDGSFLPPSSTPIVPQSTMRSSHDQNPFRNIVEATPSRKSNSNSRATHDFAVYDSDYGAVPPSSPLLPRHSNADSGAIPPSSPLQPRRSNVPLFGDVPDSVNKRPSTSTLPRGIMETPIKRPSTSHYDIEETPLKKTSELKLAHSHPLLTENQNKQNMRNMPEALEVTKTSQTNRPRSNSIYAELGWDDDDIDDLA